MSGAGDGGAWFGPVVEIWIDDTSDGQTVLVTGERPDGQRFVGSFYQPNLNDDSNNGGPEP